MEIKIYLTYKLVKLKVDLCKLTCNNLVIKIKLKFTGCNGCTCNFTSAKHACKVTPSVHVFVFTSLYYIGGNDSYMLAYVLLNT